MPSLNAPSRPRRLHRGSAALLFALIALGAIGCATTATSGSPPPEKDPWEGFNRGVYRFNDTLDRNALRPAAVAYRDHTPSWFQKGVSNFFQNLEYPGVVLNQFLQGKFKQGGQDLARLLINTTLGWGGIFDVASGARLPVHDEDLGQTLGRWGVGPGPYLMMPLLGPATLRDGPARIGDRFAEPFQWYDAGRERWVALGLELLDTRAGLLPLDRTLQEAYDPYAFIRDAYLQRRQYLVYDGQPPEEALEDDDDWIEEAERESEE